jgi:glycosyltransferase involved in cell wall biosynthesis
LAKEIRSHYMIRIGIECESIEEQSWGIARIITKLLEDIASRPELQKEFTFFLYFKSKIPDYPFLNNPIFVKKIVRVPFLPSSFSLYYYVLLPIKLWFEGLDAMFFTNYMLPLIFLGKSLVLSTDDMYYEARGKLPFRYRLAYLIFGTWGIKGSSKVLTISETAKKEIERLFKVSPTKILVNHLAVDTPYTPVKKEGRPYILFAGQAFPRRHLKETLMAYESIAHEFPDVDFQIMGVDRYNPSLLPHFMHEINQRLGAERVQHTPSATDQELANLYANAKAVTYISSREAFGLPPLEALAYGSVPVVADNAMSHEIFGEHAFFVRNPDSIGSIADALRDMLINETKCQSIKAHAPEVVKQFTWKAHTDRFLNIMRMMTHHA